MIDNMNPLNVGDCIKATFVTELPVRFRCIISIAGEEKECYVPSSCKLEPLIKLKNKEVLVRKQDSGKTSLYSLVAVKHKSNYVLLNSSYANQLFMESVARRLFGFLGKRKKVISEYTLSDYRCDFYIEDTNTIIEVKSIISDKDKVFFPAMESKRFLHQLSTIKANMIAGKKSNLIVMFHFIIVMVLRKQPFYVA